MEGLGSRFRKKPLDSVVDLDKLVEMTDGMTGADIAAMVNAAAMSAIREHVSNNKTDENLKISMRHFEAALNKIKIGSSKSRTVSWQNFPNYRSLT